MANRTGFLRTDSGALLALAITATLAMAVSAVGQTTPAPATATIDLAGAPARGPADSPVTLVMFTDFGNPAYGSTGVVLQGLVDLYPDRLRIVFKHSLPANQPERLLPHEAARAAGEQGQFWQMHDLLLANQTRQSRDDLIAMATQLHLDVSRFTADLDNGRYRAAIEADRQQADALGIRNQPTWFLNGVRIKGPVALIDLQRRIDGILK